tara:strand:- start:338 stop:511 length:174 start_codon:yes stop_codon:yes gene_type:complete
MPQKNTMPNSIDGTSGWDIAFRKYVNANPLGNFPNGFSDWFVGRASGLMVSGTVWEV